MFSTSRVFPPIRIKASPSVQCTVLGAFSVFGSCMVTRQLCCCAIAAHLFLFLFWTSFWLPCQKKTPPFAALFSFLAFLCLFLRIRNWINLLFLCIPRHLHISYLPVLPPRWTLTTPPGDAYEQPPSAAESLLGLGPRLKDGHLAITLPSTSPNSKPNHSLSSKPNPNPCQLLVQLHLQPQIQTLP